MYKLVIGSKYQQDGEEKTRWINYGFGYEKNPHVTIRLDHTIIVPPGESVWLNLFYEGKENGVQKKDESKKE